MLLVYQWLSNVFMRTIQVDANHETTISHILYLVAFNLLQLLHQVVAHLTGILHKMFLLKYVEYGQCCSTGQVVATKCSAQLSVNRLEVGRNQHTAHGEAVGNALGHCDDVGLDA